MEAAYQRIKAERAPHWRVSEHAAFEQGWKACQADTRGRPMTEREPCVEIRTTDEEENK